MKKHLFLLFLLVGCSSNQVLKNNACQYVETYWNLNDRFIVYQCEKEPKESNCHYIRKSKLETYQCIYRINNIQNNLR
jgi:uncharacterized protein YcfL